MGVQASCACSLVQVLVPVPDRSCGTQSLRTGRYMHSILLSLSALAAHLDDPAFTVLDSCRTACVGMALCYTRPVCGVSRLFWGLE